MFSKSFTFGTALVSLLSAANAYHLVQTYDQSNFFNEFGFFTGADPTFGTVDYVSKSAAESSDLITIENGQVYLGVDHTTQNPAGGRASVRLTSNQAFTQGIFIADIAHMPVGCGTWPAYWMFGPNWPASGEIDIIEGVNAQSTDSITLHTAAGCTIANPNSQSGTNTLTTNCNQDNANTGCGVSTANTNAFGAGFNRVGGGVYAMQWASSGIYVWFFQRGSIPSDITEENPNTMAWGTPMATFESGNGGCDFNTAFQNHNIVFDTTFCGGWAGGVWGSSSCGALAGSCAEYVANNPGAFANAYWLINSVKVYQ